MIIIEGADGLGKTTLCRSLSVELPTHVYSHFTRLPEKFDYYWGYAQRISPNVIQDRFHMSEVVYSTVRKVPTMLDPETYGLVDAKLRRAGGFTVVLVASDELMRSRPSRKEEMYDEEQIFAANRGFRLMTSKAYALYDYYKPDVDLVVKLTEECPYVTTDQINTILERYHHRHSRLHEVTDRRPVAIEAFDVL